MEPSTTDERLRALEREALAGAGDEAERFIHDALRRGAVDRDGLELLAHLGHRSAAEAAGVPVELPDPGALAWLGELGRWGREPLVAAAWAAAVAAQARAPGDRLAEVVVSDVRTWLAGGPERAAALVRLGPALEAWRRSPGRPRALQAVWGAGRAALALGPVLWEGEAAPAASLREALAARGVLCCRVVVAGHTSLHLIGTLGAGDPARGLADLLGVSLLDARERIQHRSPSVLDFTRQGIRAAERAELATARLATAARSVRAAVVDAVTSWALGRL
ncbi:MAG: hypothetical protein AB7N76_24550 [Planctomycetota bacterium]